MKQYPFSVVDYLLVYSLLMDYSVEDLPQDILDLYTSLHQRGFNFKARNARYRKAVCNLYQLQWMSVAACTKITTRCVYTLDQQPPVAAQANERCPLWNRTASASLDTPCFE